MSTYLVAFVVGEYDFVEKKDPDGVRVRVYTGVGKKEQGRFALDVSVHYDEFIPFSERVFPTPSTLLPLHPFSGLVIPIIIIAS